MNATLYRLQSEINSTLHGLDADQTQLRPPARAGNRETWSIQRIVEHLLLTYTQTEAALEARLVKLAPTRARPGMLQHVAQYTVLRLGYFPPGRKAPPLVTPIADTEALSGEQLAQATAQHLSTLDRRCNEAEKLFGATRRCATHMVLGPLSVDQWRKFQLIHGEHHLKQIHSIRHAHSI